MSWRDFLKRREQTDDADQPKRELPMIRTGGVQSAAGAPVVGSRRLPDDPEARARRKARLEQRVLDLRYDIQQAEGALNEPNRWTERIAELDNAIDQAKNDAAAIRSAVPQEPGIPLPPWPVTIVSLRGAEPADIQLRIGDVPFHYVEDLDWSERGHQRAPTELRRTEGDLDALMPATVPTERREQLREHLAHGLSTLVEDLRERTLDREPLPQLTLADLASPCPTCGGWRDLRGRCPACQQREWQISALEDDVRRLRKERVETLEDMQTLRDRLPLLRRRLADAEVEAARA